MATPCARLALMLTSTACAVNAGAGPSTAGRPPYLSWVGPALVRPGQGLVASGSGLLPGCTLLIRTPDGAETEAANARFSGDGAIGTVPQTLALNVWLVVVRCNATTSSAHRPSVRQATSNELTVNAPQVWWAHGDCGNESSVGGQIRLLGAGLTVSSAAAHLDDGAADAQVAELEAEVHAAVRGRRYDDAAAAASRLSRLVPAGTVGAGHRAIVRQTQLRLRSVANGKVTVLNATGATLTEHHAAFDVPNDFPPGE